MSVSLFQVMINNYLVVHSLLVLCNQPTPACDNSAWHVVVRYQLVLKNWTKLDFN